MLRFVILHHTNWPGHPDHYDLMLQFAEGSSDDDAGLKTFSTLDNEFPKASSRFQSVQDHRRAYLKFEGPLTANRGEVRRVDEGVVEWLSEHHEAIRVRLTGRVLNGDFSLAGQDGIYTLSKA